MRNSIFFLCLILDFKLFAQNPEVIKLSGNFSVSDAGSATYSVPLTLPPGIGSMKPDLSLNYNSNGGNGIMGIGWAISGLSVISRGNKTIEQDGLAYGIEFNENDVYYLDAERLVQWDETFQYGQDGSSYGTESNSFVKVVSHGVSGEGPGYFTAYTKSGLKLTFGSNDASRIFIPGTKTVLYYLLNRMEENRITGNTNYITFEYEKDENNASYRPIKIKYSQNQGLIGSNNSITEVVFEYESRNDKEVAYINGIGTSIDKRLNQLKIKQNNIDKEIYLFSYIEYGQNKKSLLQSISHCITQATIWECSDALTFDWDLQDDALQFLEKNTPIPESAIKGDNKEIYSQDINNDGLTDVLIANRSDKLSLEVYLNQGDAMFIKVVSNIQTTFKSAYVTFIDANSDGYIDIVFTDLNGTNNWYINDKKIGTQGANFLLTPEQISPIDLQGPSLNKQFYFIDYNGDSRSDFFIIDAKEGSINIFVNESDSSNILKLTKKTNLKLEIPQSVLKNNIIYPIDLNNDGKTDLFTYSRDEKMTEIKIFKNIYTSETDKVFNLISTNLSNIWFDSYPITYDNTGLNALKNRAYNGFDYKINNDRSQDENVLTLKFFGQRRPEFVDVNGDGLQDVIISKTHNQFNQSDGIEMRVIQIEKVYYLINKGNFNFEPGIPIVSSINTIDVNTGDPSCSLPECADTRCFIGYFNAHLRYNSADNGFWTRYTAPTTQNGTVFYELPRYYTDLNNDGNIDIVVRQNNFKGSDPVYINTHLFKNNSICSEISKIFNYSIDFQLSLGRFNQFGTDLFFYNRKTGQNIIQKNLADGRPPLIYNFRGQLGGDINVEYSTLNNQETYVKGSNRSYPNIAYSSSARIVKSYSKLTTDAHPEFITNFQYKYYDGVLNLTGRGFRGFKKIEITDKVQGFKVIKEFEEDSKFIASNLKSQKTYSKDGSLLSEEIYKNVTWISRSDGSGGIFIKQNTNFQDKIFTPFSSESISRTYDLKGTLLVENKSRMYLDVFGNTQYQVFDHGDGCVDSIYNEFSNDFDTWFIGRLIRSTVYKKCNNSGVLVRESEFIYNPVTSYLEKEVLEPNQDEKLRTIKTYERDDFGNITRTTEQAWNGTQVVSRTKSFKFDPLGRFQIESSNQLGHKVSIKMDPYRGLPIESTDENGLITKMKYNSFGILREIEHPDGTKSYTNSESKTFTVGFSTNSFFEFSTYGSNDPKSISTMDHTGREISNDQTLFDGTTAGSIKYYNSENRLSTYTYPYGQKQFEYDLAGRTIKTIESGNNNSALEYLMKYAGLSETNVNPLQQTMTSISDFRQRLIKSIDNAGNPIEYEYDTQGNLSQITAGNNEYIINYEYDLRGRMTAMIDPVLGREEYSYDGFGNLLRKKDGKGNIITYTYDNLNRVKTMTQAEGVVTYSYDQGNKAIGKLNKITYPNYESNLIYDNLGRLSRNTITIQGKIYVYNYSYNEIGKLDKVEHPSGITLKYHYNSNFYLSKITNNQTNKILWEIKKVDLKNRVTEEVLGNGVITTYEYDIQDNISRIRSLRNSVIIHDLQYIYNSIDLKTRKIDHKNNITEDYQYDKLNRLINVSTKGLINEELTMTYDKWGNITSKSDLGTYFYNSTIPTMLERVDFINSNCSIPSSKFDYEYTSFNKVSKITGDSVRLEITYGPDNQRLTQTIFINNIIRESRTYIGPDYEVITINNTDTRRFSISGSDGIAVIYEVTGNQAGKYSYLHRDNQGSVVAITNDLGVLQYSYIYDVWGRRKITNQVENVHGASYRGYTGHEHIVLLDLINMNGRIYDPVMARFLSPDPIIAEAGNFQNYNRFSYVYNNPVNLTDPSGYKSFRKTFSGWGRSASKTIGRIGNGISAIASGHIRDGLKSFGQSYIDIVYKWWAKPIHQEGQHVFGAETWNQIVVASASITVSFFLTPAAGAVVGSITSGFVAGAGSAYLSGAGTNDILKAGFKGASMSGISAGLTYGVGSGIQELGAANTVLGEGLRAVGHGAVQGTMNELQGGKFSSGFYSGVVSSIGSHTKGLYGGNRAIKVFSASLVGGATSSFTGGKFANGAVSGAFIEMYNCELHQCRDEEKVRFKGGAFASTDGKTIGYNQVVGVGGGLFGPSFGVQTNLDRLAIEPTLGIGVSHPIPGVAQLTLDCGLFSGSCSINGNYLGAGFTYDLGKLPKLNDQNSFLLK